RRSGPWARSDGRLAQSRGRPAPGFSPQGRQPDRTFDPAGTWFAAGHERFYPASLAAPDSQDAQGDRTAPEPDLSSDPQRVRNMSSDVKLIDFGAERDKRIHDLNDKRLAEMRQAFEPALSLGKGKPAVKSKKKKPGKRQELLPFVASRVAVRSGNRP